MLSFNILYTVWDAKNKIKNKIIFILFCRRGGVADGTETRNSEVKDARVYTNTSPFSKKIFSDSILTGANIIYDSVLSEYVSVA